MAHPAQWGRPFAFGYRNSEAEKLKLKQVAEDADIEMRNSRPKNPPLPE
jgi:hypothetical protein